jgi:hypothetical protein
MTLLNKFPAKLGIIKDFTIKNNPQGFIFIGKRLPPPLKVYNRQPGMSQASIVPDIEPKAIRPSMPQRIDHPLKNGFV